MVVYSTKWHLHVVTNDFWKEKFYKIRETAKEDKLNSCDYHMIVYAMHGTNESVAFECQKFISILITKTVRIQHFEKIQTMLPFYENLVKKEA